MRDHTPSSIVHAAAITAVDPATERSLGARMVEVNVVGTLRLLEVARQSKVRRMLYISSSGVYGSTQVADPIPETAPLPDQELGLYTISKIAAERLCLRYAELMDVDVVVGRLSGPYGPMERDTGVRPIMSPIYQLATAALTQDDVRARAEDASFDWTCTLDLALAAQLLLEAETLRYRVYNLSGGEPSTPAEVVDALDRALGGISVAWVGRNDPERVDVDIAVGRRYLDITRLRGDTGFAPRYGLEQGLTMSLPWWRAMLASEGRLLRR
jgi:nucleoside-diphosphate-sugar epimerase